MTTPAPAGSRIHVSPSGDDGNDGRADAPLRSIRAAAARAQPGDVVTVHAGIYRERVDPPRGGLSATCRIVYEAAAGESVAIKGSEEVKTWVPVTGDVWKVVLPNAWFGDFNPYRDALRGHWFIDKGRRHHSGAVYLDGHWLAEAQSLDEVFSVEGAEPLWFGQVDEAGTTLHAQFRGVDPNVALVEVNVRQSVFYPSAPGVDYVTVRGFTLCHAATPWAPPTTEQIGCIGVNWSKGWRIEDNRICYSTCAGLTLGKYHDPLDGPELDILEGTAGADTYHGTIDRALRNGWDVERVGHHVVRGNTISHCEMAGIAGSLGAVCSRVTGNTIHDIHVRRQFGGHEQAGIKFHGAINTEISGNRIFRCFRGIWLDWMSQGTRVTGNLLYGNDDAQDLFMEVNHGPFVVDNNLFLSRQSVASMSHGGAYVHNLFLGGYHAAGELGRHTPYHRAHSTALAGLACIPKGDDRLINNLVVEASGLSSYDDATDPVWIEDNLYLGGAAPGRYARGGFVLPGGGDIRVEDKGERVILHIGLDPAWGAMRRRRPVTGDRLGRTLTAGLPYEHPDGTALRVDTDYFGNRRGTDNPFPGPFEMGTGAIAELCVWPVGAGEGNR